MTTAIAESVARVRERIAAACARAGRRPESVKLVAVSKTFPPERIREAYEAGLRDFGENRVQEAAGKRPALSDLTATWHLVGHLQSNKAAPALELFHWIHSLDSAKLAERLHRAAVPPLPPLPHSRESGNPEAGPQSPSTRSGRLAVLLQVSLAGEVTKSGACADAVLKLAEEAGHFQTLEIRGLMTIPPFFENPEQSRPFFRRLGELARRVESANIPGVSMSELSMGMSNDFEVAIEEGATMVRIGTAIFGERAQRGLTRQES